MARAGIVYTLDAPQGSIQLGPITRDNGVITLIEQVTGLDSWKLNVTSHDRAYGDGTVRDRASRSNRVAAFQGLIWHPEADWDAVAEVEDAIKAALISCENADAILSWPVGSETRQAAVRAFEHWDAQPSGVAPQVLRFTFSLDNESGLVVASTQRSHTINAGDSYSAQNGGNAKAYPVLKLHGPFSGGAKLVNGRSGAVLHFDSLAVDSGHFVYVDTLGQSARLDGPSGRRMDGTLEPTQSEFFALGTGYTTLTFTTGSGGGTCEVIWHDGKA